MHALISAASRSMPRRLQTLHAPISTAADAGVETRFADRSTPRPVVVYVYASDFSRARRCRVALATRRLLVDVVVGVIELITPRSDEISTATRTYDT